MLYLCICDVHLLFMLSSSFKKAHGEEREGVRKNILAFHMYVALLAKRPGRNQDSLNLHITGSSTSQSVQMMARHLLKSPLSVAGVSLQ